MNKITKTIKILKEKREKILELEKEKNIKRANNDPKQFYEDSLKISNINDGMVIIITDCQVIKEKATGGISHRKVVQEIFDTISNKNIDLSKVDSDYGDVITKEYGYIFIRMASVLNGSTIIYYPNICNDFQIEKLTEFNNQIKEYNDTHNIKVTFEYNENKQPIQNNLDELITELNSKNIIKK